MATQYLVGPSRPYTTIQAAINAIPNTMTGTGIHEVIVDAGAYNEQVIIDNVSTFQDYVILRAATGSEHKGIYNTGVRIINPFEPLFCDSFWLRVSDVQIFSSRIDSTFFGVRCTSCIFTNILIFATNISSASIGIQYRSATHSAGTGQFTTIFINCGVISQGPLAPINGVQQANTGPDGIMYNCFTYNCSNGFLQTASNREKLTLFNCWANRTAYGGSFGTASSNNASTDSSAPGLNPSINQTLANFAFTNVSVYDFHITNSSSLYNVGINKSSIFTQDIDHETISLWPIGYDAGREVNIPTMASSPWKNQNKPHNQIKPAEAPELEFLEPEDSPELDKTISAREAKVPIIQTLKPSASSPLSQSSSKVSEAKPPSIQTLNQGAPSGKASNGKSYKNGFVSAIPETGGYNSSGLGTGNRLFITSESLGLNKSFDERVQVGARGGKSRATQVAEPSGKIEFAFRSNDVIPVLMSHFQTRVGTTPAVGTTYYEFYTAKTKTNLIGSAFGTGTYGASGDAFSVSLYKAFEGTGYHFQKGLCDRLSFSLLAGDEATIGADFKFSTATVTGTTGFRTGSYSTLPAYPSFAGTISIPSFEVVEIKFECNNNLKSFQPVGYNGYQYNFGRHVVSGRVTVDRSKSILASVGSMLGTEAISIYGTLFNSQVDKLEFELPNCRLDDYALNSTDSIVTIPFHAYESENGLTPAIKFKVWTTGYSATTFQPN